MGIWIAAASVICCITGICFRRAGLGKIFILRIFDGLLLAFLCFVLFPVVFEKGNFFAGIVGILFGVLLGAYLERKTMFLLEDCSGKDFLHSGAFLLAVLLAYFQLPKQEIEIMIYSFIVALSGGLFLFITCGGILPECCGKKWQVVSAVGGFLGFLMGVFLLF